MRVSVSSLRSAPVSRQTSKAITYSPTPVRHLLPHGKNPSFLDQRTTSPHEWNGKGKGKSSKLWENIRDGRSVQDSGRYARGTSYRAETLLVSSPSDVSSTRLRFLIETHLSKHWNPDNAQRADSDMVKFGQDLGVSGAEFDDLVRRFNKWTLTSLSSGENQDVWNLESLRKVYTTEGITCLTRMTQRAFAGWIADHNTDPPFAEDVDPSQMFPKPVLANLRQLVKTVDLRYPGERNYTAREARRKIILHIGPTNSGKTHAALMALSKARVGVYAGPLRLLAHEIFTRFNEGKIGEQGQRPCNLITGEEKRIRDATLALTSCTVEMLDFGAAYDVCILDEIQMIADPSRGGTWAAALLGLNCRELHLCGEESVEELITKIVADLGDELEVKRYQRLSPLVISNDSLRSSLNKIRKGDCLVTFSRSKIHFFKDEIEKITGLKVAVAYGGLPPEVREAQARHFNEGKFDVLVASDAVGMGLNLKIKRIVFETLRKWDGKEEVSISIPQIKQIAGRAGRFGLSDVVVAGIDDDVAQKTISTGEVTTFRHSDLEDLRKALAHPTIQIEKGSIVPMSDQLKNFYLLLPPNASLDSLYRLALTLTRTSNEFTVANENGREPVAALLNGVKGLSFTEKDLFCSTPVNIRDNKVATTLLFFAKAHANGNKVLIEKWSQQSGLDSLMEQIEAVKVEQANNVRNLSALPKRSNLPYQRMLIDVEGYHRCVSLYVWLTFRLPDTFCDSASAKRLKSQCEMAILDLLAAMISRGSKRPHPGFAIPSTSIKSSSVAATL